MNNKYAEIREHALKEYERWVSNTKLQENFNHKLLKLYGNEEEIVDSFCRDLPFEMSRIRGILGPGTNRINGFVIRRAAQGVANYLKKSRMFPEVVIAYDTRQDSERFAYEIAAVFAGNEIKVNIFPVPTPAPLLSHAVRYLKCSIGIMVTASHYSKRYNGFKVYNEKGCQVIGRDHDIIRDEIEHLDYFSGIGYKKDEAPVIVPDRVIESFIALSSAALPPVDNDLFNTVKTVYTPLNGTGGETARRIFERLGYRNYDMCEIQAGPDPDFTTCPVPNPERILAYNESFKLLDELGGDIIVANDPDGDRMGCALYHDGMRTLLTGNQIGILILDYLCHIRPPKKGQILIRSAATTPLYDRIAARYGLNVVKTPIGFKYIGEIVAKLEEHNSRDVFYFGAEESDGYLIQPYICEKDGFSAAALIIEIAAFHRAQGKDLIDRLYEIYEEFGVCMDKTGNYVFNGSMGRVHMEQLMDYFRNSLGEEMGGRKITEKIDYLQQTDTVPFNMIELHFDEGSRLLIRPSTTESKLRVYSFTAGNISSVQKDLVRIIERFKYSGQAER